MFVIYIVSQLNVPSSRKMTGYSNEAPGWSSESSLSTIDSKTNCSIANAPMTTAAPFAATA
jgi:hypothetical protein